MKKFWPLVFIVFAVIVFFKPLIMEGKLPIPADTIVGLYHPYIDLYAKDYPRGIPFKNSLVTDPVRQQYPWKNLVVEIEKRFELPLWNPYNFAGIPLLANFQSGAFYPLNLLLFIPPFSLSWSFFVFIQPILGGIFMFFYLRNLKLKNYSSFLGTLSFVFGGFSIAWLEWGNIINTVIWLPLILLATDKIFENIKNRREAIKWSIIFLISLVFSFFAGYLQAFFYISILSFSYFVFRTIENKRIKEGISILIPIYALFVLITSIQWIPTLQLINLSARNIDQSFLQSGWFVPWQNAIQYIFPDFFGNPATLNYFGVWNYGEFIGYVGIIPLIFAIFALLFKKSKTVFLFLAFLIIAAIFAFPNPISRLPYRFDLPFISTAQPTRLTFIIGFCLSVLSAFGLNIFLEEKNKKYIIIPLLVIFAAIAISWAFVLMGGFGYLITTENLNIAKRNLLLPSILFAVSATLLILIWILPKKIKNFDRAAQILTVALLLVVVFDLFRFGWKFTPFTYAKYLYPNSKVLDFVTENIGNYRIMEADDVVFPPNFSIMYKLQSVDGYDPLYLLRYGELMASVGRGEPNISSPFGFNRIINPQNYKSDVTDFLGVKYILSAHEITEPTLKKVLQEGQTIVYENTRVADRAFFVGRTINSFSKQQTINFIFDNNFSLKQRAVAEGVGKSFARTWNVGKANIERYSENEIEINTQNEDEGFLVLSDTFYPTWHATIDGQETKIYLTNYNFRGIIVPKGEHKIIFYDKLF